MEITFTQIASTSMIPEIKKDKEGNEMSVLLCEGVMGKTHEDFPEILKMRFIAKINGDYVEKEMSFYSRDFIEENNFQNIKNMAEAKGITLN